MEPVGFEIKVILIVGKPKRREIFGKCVQKSGLSKIRLTRSDEGIGGFMRPLGAVGLGLIHETYQSPDGGELLINVLIVISLEFKEVDLGVSLLECSEIDREHLQVTEVLFPESFPIVSSIMELQEPLLAREMLVEIYELLDFQGPGQGRMALKVDGDRIVPQPELSLDQVSVYIAMVQNHGPEVVVEELDRGVLVPHFVTETSHQGIQRQFF